LCSKRSPARSPFAARVLAAVRRIPPGCVATYGDVAALAGQPRAHRAVGNIMRECRDPGTPCHRVIASGGGLGGYGGNLQIKRELLRAEGIEVGERRVRGFESVRWAAKRAKARTTRNKPKTPS
jgi:methylated-DNA-[protein]-cysteine S-methyltransferase